MKYFTFVLTKEEQINIKELYRDYTKPFDNENVSFFAIKGEIELTLYKTGKLLLKGLHLRNEISLIKSSLGRKDYAAIGSDEVGTGDVFGPVTVCAAYVSLEDIEFLEELNVRDTKSVSDAFVIKTAPLIAKRLTHSLIILKPNQYNALVDEGYNLNKIKAHLHNQAIVSLTDKLKTNQIPVILDQFCQPNLYFNYLKDELLVYRDISFHTKAENVHISVAAAAIIARYAFLYSLQQCSKNVNLKLLKGATKLVDEQIEDILEGQGLKKLLSVSKKNFKNITKLNL